MVSLIKNFFGQRELTDQELFSYYNKSSKSIKDFNDYIMNIKEGRDAIAVNVISEIKINNFDQIEELVQILENNDIDKGISLSTNKAKKKLNSIYNQLKTILLVHQKFLSNDEQLIHFIYSNKFELFSYLRKNYEKNKNELLLNFIYDNYFTEQNYLKLIDYFIFKDYENDIKFLLPNEFNINIFKTKNNIPTYINLKEIYYDFDNNNKNNQVNNLLLNLIIFFNNKHKEEDEIIKNLSKYLPNKNFEHVEIILSLYKLAQKIDNKLTLEVFLKNKNIFENFQKIATVDYNTFSHILSNLISNSREYGNIYRNLKYLPLEILKNLLISKAKYDYITKGIDLVLESSLYNNTMCLNFILKISFDYYCFNKMSLNQLSKIVNYLSKYNSNINGITNQIDLLIEIIEIFDKQNMEFSINNLIKDDLNDISQENIYIQTVIEYLNNLLEIAKQNNKYNFIDNNITEIDKLKSYKKAITYGKLLFYYFNQYEKERNLILEVLTSNKNLILNQAEIKSLIDLFLLNSNSLKAESYNSIEKFLDDEENVNLMSPDVQVKLENLLEFLKTKMLLEKYKIDDIDSYSMGNYKNKIPQILELLLIKSANFDNISDLKEFLGAKNSEEIRNSLMLNANKYIFLLFTIFVKYQRNNLAKSAIELLIQKNEIKYFNKCLDYVFNDICKKNENNFKNICRNLNVVEYLIENNNKYLDLFIHNSNDFNKEDNISFPINKSVSDLLILHSLTKNGEIKDNKNEFVNSYVQFTNFNGKKNLYTLIDIYNKNSENDDKSLNQVNYSYSLHPKLTEIIKSKGYWNLFKDLKINLINKIKIYNFCLKNKICSLEDIINTFESLKIKQKSKSDKNFIEKYKLIFNLYKEEEFSNSNIIKDIQNTIRENYTDEENNKNVLLLIDYNLSNKLYLSYDNIMFIKNIFLCPLAKTLLSVSEDELNILKILSLFCTKINILVFCSNFNQIFTNDKKFSEVFEKYYKNNFNITILEENNIYFNKLKNKYYSKSPNVFYQCAELYNVLTISNVFNILKIMNMLNNLNNNFNKENIYFIFALRVINNYLTMSAVIPNRINEGLNYTLNIINSFNLSNSEIENILCEIFNFPSLSFINSSTHNILILDDGYKILMRQFLEAKTKLVDEIINIYYQEEDLPPVLLNKYKIFLIKVTIIKDDLTCEKSDLDYNYFKNLDDYKDLNELVKKNQNLQNEIYNIYTQ